MNDFQFFWEFVRAPGRTGAIASSSSRLAEVVTEAADLKNARCVIEFGCGTGVFTEKILGKMAEGALFFAMDINAGFARATRRRCPGADVILDSAVNAPVHLRQRGREHCDRIVSGLPWVGFSEPLQDQLLATIDLVLVPGGSFLTFGYLQGLLLPGSFRFRRKLSAHFSEVTTTPIVWRNLPPAFVYCARK